MSRQRWVFLSYRIPREPSTPRIAAWRKLRSLGAAQVVDGLAALPLNDRTREQFEWLAQSIRESNGTGDVWIAEATTSAQEAQLTKAISEGVADEYKQLTATACEARGAASPGSRTLTRLRRELRRIEARDYFGEAAGSAARKAVETLARAVGAAK